MTDQPNNKTNTIINDPAFPEHRQIECGPSPYDSEYNKYFYSACDMRFIVKQDWKLVDINESGVAIFRFESKDEMLLLDSLACLFGNRKDVDLIQRKIEEDGLIKDFTVAMRRKDGGAFLASMTAHLWCEENGVVYYEGVLRDISTFKRMQHMLPGSEKCVRDDIQSESYNRQLNHHVAQILSMMSHDIRGPLVAIAATLKLLLRGTYGNMDESVRNTIRDLLPRATQLLGLAEDYLSGAHSLENSSKSECEMLDLRHDIIDPVLCEMEHEIQYNHVRIDNRLGAIPAGSIHVNVKKIWLKAVYRNLFKNAIKYGGEGCTIAFGFEDHGSYYRLNVYNTGIPIPQDRREKLFTRFGRIGLDGDASVDGIGLGLYLIREIIRKHGGDIWYEAKRRGSDFVFTLVKERIE